MRRRTLAGTAEEADFSAGKTIRAAYAVDSVTTRERARKTAAAEAAKVRDRLANVAWLVPRTCATAAVKSVTGRELLSRTRDRIGKNRRGPKPDDKCRSCGEEGHWARDCPQQKKDDAALAEEGDDAAPATMEDAPPVPTPTPTPRKKGARRIDFAKRASETPQERRVVKVIFSNTKKLTHTTPLFTFTESFFMCRRFWIL